MKIISKFKDFYDYKMTKYGVDEKLVYTRKTYYEYSKRFSININTEFTERISEEKFNKYFKEYTEYFMDNNCHKVLFIGKKLIHLFFTENGIYTHLDIKDSKDLKKKDGQWYHYYEITFNDEKKYRIYTPFRYDWNELISYDREKVLSHIDASKDDILFNEPMLLLEYLGKFNKKKVRYPDSIYRFTYNPNLSKLGIYIDEDFIWQSLVEFLSNKRSEKEIIPEVSDKNKILSKGFDLKSSFRPNMKKTK
mgnify:FL=1